MVEKTNKKQKKGFISEADISSLLQRYSANTVLALLQEVAQFPDVKLDWDALVKKTSTGISNAREYQMLWRHLAYRNNLVDQLEDEAQPLDDDSDLEYELEASPEISTDTSNEAAACVKVLIASTLPSGSTIPNSSMIEGPLTIKIPNGPSFRASEEYSQPSCLMQGMNITVPVAVPKLPLPSSMPTDLLDANGSVGGNMPPRKRRKPWTSEEDVELLAAVQKCGEGNWANILRGDFKWDRTASQLSQRWNILRKKNGSMIVASSPSGTQLTERQLATRNAISHALDLPVKNITATSTNNNAGTASNNTKNNHVPSAANAETSSVPIQSKLSPLGSPGYPAKPRIPFKKIPTKCNFSTDSSIRAAAVAAGARIVTSSDAASLLKVGQPKKSFQIMPSTVSSIKSPITSSSSAPLEASSSMRCVRPSLSVAPSSSTAAVSSSALHPGLVKAALPKVQHQTSPEQTDVIVSVPVAASPQEAGVKAGEDVKVSDCSVPQNKPSKEVPVELPKPEAAFIKQEAVVEKPDSSSNTKITENDHVEINGIHADRKGNQNSNGGKVMDSQVERAGKQAAVGENDEMLLISKTEEAELPPVVINNCSCQILEVASEMKASM